MTNDDAAQADQARAIVEEDFHVPATVLVEVDWVLRSFYGWSRAQRVAGFRILLDMPRAVSMPKRTAWAVERMAAGADFADMMHLVASDGASSFATFDRKLAGRAGAEAPMLIETLR